MYRTERTAHNPETVENQIPIEAAVTLEGIHTACAPMRVHAPLKDGRYVEITELAMVPGGLQQTESFLEE